MKCSTQQGQENSKRPGPRERHADGHDRAGDGWLGCDPVRQAEIIKKLLDNIISRVYFNLLGMVCSVIDLGYPEGYTEYVVNYRLKGGKSYG